MLKEEEIRIEIILKVGKDKLKMTLEGLDYAEAKKRVIELLSYGYNKNEIIT